MGGQRRGPGGLLRCQGVPSSFCAPARLHPPPSRAQGGAAASGPACVVAVAAGEEGRETPRLCFLHLRSPCFQNPCFCKVGSGGRFVGSPRHKILDDRRALSER